MDSGSLIDRIRRGDNAELQKVYEMYRGEFIAAQTQIFQIRKPFKDIFRDAD